MTEAQWLAATDPSPLLAFLQGNVSDRKQRLFACGCCRRIWHLLSDERSREAVEGVERHAEGLATEEEWAAACASANAAAAAATEALSEADALDGEDRLTAPAYAAAEAACSAAGSLCFVLEAPPRAANAAFSAACAVGCNAEAAAYATGADGRAARRADEAALAAECVAQANLLRDLVGDPFRKLPPVALSLLTWNGGMVRRLAEAAHDNRVLPSGHLDPARLAVMADALEEAGCTEAELLGHLRGPGPHVRGCWAVDRVRSVD
jgi:hypothetical protein